MTKSHFLILLFCLIYSNTIHAQSTETQQVTAVIQQLFDGFRENDSSKVAQTFFDRSPFLGTSFIRNNQTQFRKDAGLKGMLDAVAQVKPDSARWDERIYNLEVKIDDGLASVYCPYSFYVGKTFSHCGVNFFTLTKTASGWKILSVVDTRRKECKS